MNASNATIWTIADDSHRTGAIAMYEHHGVLVLVSDLGRYPTAVAADGRSTKDAPHIDISVGGGSYDRAIGKSYFSGVTVTARGRYFRGFRRDLVVFQDLGYGEGFGKTSVSDPWVRLGEEHLDAAVDVLMGLDAAYDAAEATIARSDVYTGPLSRPEYEAAARELGCELLPDAGCDCYAVRYFNFPYPQYTALMCNSMRIAALRLAAIDAERLEASMAQARPVAVVPVCRQGQLWEPCERCGAEPVNMPLHLCDGCWPK